MKNLNILCLLALAMDLSLSACVASVQDVKDYSGTIAPGDGVLAIVVNSDVSFQDLRLIRPHDVFAAIAARNLPRGRSVRFVELPAGDYEWSAVDLSDYGNMHYWVPLDNNKEQLYQFTVKPGVINYPGDFVVGTDNNSFRTRYYIQLVDRSAMLLDDITIDQQKMLDEAGWAYTGPGSDNFPAYIKSIGAKGKQP